MMETYCVAKKYKDCIQLFKKLSRGDFERLQPDAITFSISLKASTESTAYRVGHRIAENIMAMENNHIRQHLSVQINLIDFYGKCGMIDSAKDIFQQIKSRE